MTANLLGVTGGTPGEFFPNLRSYYEQMTGQIAAASDLANQGSFPATAVFLSTLQQLQQLSAQDVGALKTLEDFQSHLKEWKKEVEKARDSLAECEAGAARGVV